MVQKLVVAMKMLLVATLLISYIQAGVVRMDSGSKVAVQSSSPHIKMEVEAETTTEVNSEDVVEAATESLLIEALPPLAVTRDEGATIVIAYQATLDPAPDTLEDSEVILETYQGPKNKSEIYEQKSAPLLLLSAPKINEKAKEQEENIEEPEDDLPQDGETTEAAMTTTVELNISSTAMPLLVQTMKEKVPENDNTPLAPLNETLKTQCGALKKTDVGTPTLQQQEDIQSIPNDNFGSTFLIADEERDYVIVHGDVEDFGSFTHIGSDEHLQPIVQSVEIVPTSVDEELIVNYGHSW